MIPRLLGALVGEDFLRRKREEVEEEYKRLESQIPDAVRKSLQARFLRQAAAGNIRRHRRRHRPHAEP